MLRCLSLSWPVGHELQSPAQVAEPEEQRTRSGRGDEGDLEGMKQKSQKA